MLKEALQAINQMQRDGVIGKYAIGGAIGALFYLEPSLTKDIDVFVTLPTPAGGKILSLSQIYEYLLARGFAAEAEYIIVGTWPVQFLPATTALELEGLNEAVQAETEGITSWVMTAEHLVAICLQTGRLKDYARIGQFIEHEAVDMKKLERVIERHGLASKWKTFLERYPHE